MTTMATSLSTTTTADVECKVLLYLLLLSSSCFWECSTIKTPMTTMTTSLATTRTAADTAAAADNDDAKFELLFIGVVIVFKSYS